MELKQYAKPGTASYQDQPPVKEWLSEIRQAFWPGLTGADYDLVTIAGGGLFWIREKRVSLIDVPYSSEKKHEVDFVMGLAAYDANLLGLAHGSQAQVCRLPRGNSSRHQRISSRQPRKWRKRISSLPERLSRKTQNLISS